jgi:mannose-6-phosphate isomerase-like protein (cupin superfamily)
MSDAGRRPVRPASRDEQRWPPGIRSVGATDRLAGVDPIDVNAAKGRLEAAGGGYEIVHESPGIEVGVYVLVAPEPDRQQPHEDDELYVVLEGRGVLEVEGEQVAVSEGKAAFVPAGADHRFTGYEGLTVVVIFAKR